MVFRGGVVYTVDESQPRAEGVAVRDGRIVFVGSAEEASDFVGPETEVVELAGRMLLPGFIDTHVHPVSGGIELGECDLNPAATRDEVIRIVADCAARMDAEALERTAGNSASTGADPSAPAWLRGGGFQLPFFPNGAPPAALLDSLVPNRPAYLTSADAHTAWVNTRALELAGITATTPDPLPDGIIVRTPDGSPQGTLRESAMELVARLLEERSEAAVRAGLDRGLELAARFGITTVHEASASPAFARAYASAEREGRLTARAVVALRVDPERGTEQIPELVALRDETRGRLVRPVAAKIFLDGVIEGGTAALLEPYLDQPGSRGALNLPPDSLNALVAALDDAGFKVHVHAIGDRAIRVALDAFEAASTRASSETADRTESRHIIAHIQLFDPADLPRFQALGVVASFQPLWAYADTYIVDLTEPRLGPERARWLYPIRSLMETGAIVAAGSDWSVTSMDPLRAIEVALTRRDPDLDAGEPWIPEERVGLEAMLRAYTLNGAMAGDMEEETGSISVGKSADLVVLDTDLFSVPPERISDARVELTLFEGRVVYRRE